MPVLAVPGPMAPPPPSVTAEPDAARDAPRPVLGTLVVGGAR